MAPSVTHVFAAKLAETPLQLPAVEGGILAHGSGGEDELVAECRWNGAPGFQQRFEMGLGGLLEPEQRFAPVVSMRVTARQQAGFGNPHAVFVLTEPHFRKRNNHRAETVTRSVSGVKRTFDGEDFTKAKSRNDFDTAPTASLNDQ